MSITPDDPRHVLPADHPIVATAVAALRHFATDLDRATAAILLPMWSHASELSDREYRSVLAAFPAGDIPPGSWLHDASLGVSVGGWLSGGMTGASPVDEALAVVRDWAAGAPLETVSREQAAGVLKFWAGWTDLDESTRGAVLARFPSADGGWLSGAMA